MSLQNFDHDAAEPTAPQRPIHPDRSHCASFRTRTKPGMQALALASSLFCGFAAQATEQEDAVADLKKTVETIATSGVVSQIQELHKQLQGYEWRTVYAFTQVSKAPMPGTRLALRPLPAMSQMDAEQHLISIEDTKDLPGLNCPVATLGGPAGRPVVVSQTVAGKTVAVTLSDAQIRNLFMRASPASGAQAFNAYMALKTNTCGAIYNTAQLNYRYAKLLSYTDKWEDCKKNGATVSTWTVPPEGPRVMHFKGRQRSVWMGGGINFVCGAVVANNEDGGFTYDSWFKWSNDNPVPLNIIQKLRDSQGTDGGSSCPRACIPVKKGALDLSICVGIVPGISAVKDTAPMKIGINANYNEKDHKLCSPTINVPAPFGLAQSLGEMQDTKRKDLKDKMENQIMALVPINNEMKGNIEKLQTLFGS